MAAPALELLRWSPGQWAAAPDPRGEWSPWGGTYPESMEQGVVGDGPWSCGGTDAGEDDRKETSAPAQSWWGTDEPNSFGGMSERKRRALARRTRTEVFIWDLFDCLNTGWALVSLSSLCAAASGPGRGSRSLLGSCDGGGGRVWVEREEECLVRVSEDP